MIPSSLRPVDGLVSGGAKTIAPFWQSEVLETAEYDKPRRTSDINARRYLA
jgi:hypothetical protein